MLPRDHTCLAAAIWVGARLLMLGWGSPLVGEHLSGNDEGRAIGKSQRHDQGELGKSIAVLTFSAHIDPAAEESFYPASAA
jgi:hypothetical protein